LCRHGAAELSKIKPDLDANKVRLVGIGLEELGLEEFQKGEYFKGELFIDADKKSYQALGLKKYGYLAGMALLLKSAFREQYSRSKEAGITGNTAGDGMQTGGTLIVEKGGNVIYSHKMTNFGDHATPNDVLAALKIEGGSSSAEATEAPSCTSREACEGK